MKKYKGRVDVHCSNCLARLPYEPFPVFIFSFVHSFSCLLINFYTSSFVQCETLYVSQFAKFVRFKTLKTFICNNLMQVVKQEDKLFVVQLSIIKNKINYFNRLYTIILISR